MKLPKLSFPPSFRTSICIAAYAFTLAIVLRNVLSGSIPFWYDPARDLLQGLENLQKPTLIGPPSGISGIFYGPYWTWMLSVGLVVSKDPRVVSLIALVIPYFLIMPILLYRLRTIFGLGVVSGLWLLFIFASSSYVSHLWNPHVAPLLLFVLLYFLITASYTLSKKNLLLLFFSGVLAGLVYNFHISLGVGVMAGSLLYLVFYGCVMVYGSRKKSESIRSFLVLGIIFYLGALIAFLPYGVFEIRHGFQQTNVLIQEVTGSTSTVLLSGLSQQSILEQFFGMFARLLSLPTNIGHIVLSILSLVGIYYLLRIRKSLTDIEKRLLFILPTLAGSILGIYLSAKNPVWEYHFIGIEVLWLFWLALILKHVPYLRIPFYLLVMFLCVLQLIGFTNALRADPYQEATLAAKQHVVETIYDDSKGKSFATFSYNPAIYTYDYDYLFGLIGESRGNKPVQPQDTTIVYLIIPQTSQGEFDTFINAKTPGYKTTNRWRITNGTVILKREKK